MWYLNIHRWLSLIEIDIKSTQIPAKLLRGEESLKLISNIHIFFGALVQPPPAPPADPFLR